jgi:hypothetical protein
VELYPFDSDPGNYEFWNKVGQMMGNFTELQVINIRFLPYTESDDDGDEAPSPNWEILTRILQYLRCKVALCLSIDDYYTRAEEIQDLARVINGRPMISDFTSLGCTFENTALGVLPWQRFPLWNVLHLVLMSQKQRINLHLIFISQKQR